MLQRSAWFRRGRARITTCLVLVGAACLATVPAGAALASAGAAFTLEQAVTQAVTGSAFDSARLTLERARLQFDQAMATNVLSPSPYAELVARHDLAQAENQFVTSHYDTVSSVIGAYLDALSARWAVRVATLQVQNARATRDAVRQKARAGSVGPLDVQDAENRLRSAENQLASAQLNLTQSMTRLLQWLGYPEPAPAPEALSLPDALPDAPSLTADQAVQKALAASRDLAWRREALDIARQELEQARAEQASPIQIRLKENAVRQAELALQQAESELRHSVPAALAQVQVSRTALDVAKSALALERQRYDGTRQQHDLGLKTEQDVASAEVAVAQAEQSVVSAVKNYLTALVQLNRLLGAPPGFGPADLLGSTAQPGSSSAPAR